jgi:type IV secretion system protein VirB2
MKKSLFFILRIISLSFLLLTSVPQAFVSSAQAQDVATKDAVDKNVLVTVMCNALRLVTGNAGKAFAAFAIISVGIGFFTGKVSWGLMIGIAMGIAAMFGAPTIVGALTGSGSFDCGTYTA